MHGLTVRWSLADAPSDTLDKLRTYVEDVSFAKFAGLDGLRFKSWRAREGEWFEGSYVFASANGPRRVPGRLRAHGGRVGRQSSIIGSGPILIEPCEIVAVVRGPSGFRSSPTFER